MESNTPLTVNMDYFKKLTPQCISEIFKYTSPSNVSDLKNTDHVMRDIVNGDEHKHMWSDMIKETYGDGDLKLLKGGSVVETALIIRESRINRTCALCNSVKDSILSEHPFYKILVCRYCMDYKTLRVCGLKSALRDNFLDPNESPSTLVKRKHGSFYKVLEHHVEKLAKDRYPDGKLEDMKSNRSMKRIRLYHDRRQAPIYRNNCLQMEYNMLVRGYTCRIDRKLEDLLFACDLAAGYNTLGPILGDILQNKIKSSKSTMDAAKDLRDFSWMMTYMRTHGVVTDEYVVTSEYADIVDPKHILSIHMINCDHYYVTINNLVSSVAQYTERVDKMGEFIRKNNPTLENRRYLANVASIEDGIDLDESVFSDFIEKGEGNPVHIAREKRKMIFLNMNGYMQSYSECISIGLGHERSHLFAKNGALKRTRGFRPMFAVCRITLSVR